MTPVTPEPRLIDHFAHNHILSEFEGTGEFTCNGCNNYGSSGMTYRCAKCNYNLHEYCATCPLTLGTFSHPPHDLRLVYRPTPEPTPQNEPRLCDICEKPAEGLLYECEPCWFQVHPLCTKLPQFVRHALHPEHPLELIKTGTGACNVCGGACLSWKYNCFPCGFGVHTECVAATEMKQGSTQPQQPYSAQYYPQSIPYYAYGQQPFSPQHYGNGTAPSSPPYHPGNGSSYGHRRTSSCEPKIEGGNGNETPRKNKFKGLKKSVPRFGVMMAAHAMGLPGVDYLVDHIQGSNSSDS